jgi:transcription antitermination factor NusG
MVLYIWMADLEGVIVSPWYAIRVRSNFENAVSASLASKGYPEFLPTYRSRRRWSDRIKEVRMPLFPGYVFCRFDPNNRLPILQTPGVVNVVSFAKTPTPVEESEIAAVQRIVASDVLSRPWPFLNAGDRVQVIDGPLAGLEGILLEFKKSLRLVVSVTLLQRSVAVEIDGDWVRPLCPRYSIPVLPA